MRVWIDIENPPQVQYLSPFKAAFEKKGNDVVVTARDQGMTLQLLEERGIEPVVQGAESPGSTVRKVANVVARGFRLYGRFARRERPDLLVAASRPAGLAAWSLRIPTFQFSDYEHSDLRVVRHTGAYFLHPDVIDSATLVAQGFRADRLVPFAGLKEAISFSGIDVWNTPTHRFPGLDRDDVAKLAFRPPSETAHYYASESRTLTLELLRALADREDVVVIYIPRYPSQLAYLDRATWKRAPYVLEGSVPFVPLLKALDAVVSSGGTMLREAAYLGIPAYSILRSGIGQVDRYLESIGRLTIIESADRLGEIRPRPPQLDPLPSAPDLVGDLVETMLEIAGRPRR
jgi:hypothetical protein